MALVKCLTIPVFEDHERFLKRITIDQTTGCWNWAAYKNKAGYGTFPITVSEKMKKYYAHRVSYTVFKNIIAKGMDIDHVCQNTSCCNPEHLREVDRRTNLSENVSGKSAPFLHRGKTVCKNGHEYAGENVYRMGNGGRDCHICMRARTIAYRKTPRGIQSRVTERENRKIKLKNMERIHE